MVLDEYPWPMWIPAASVTPDQPVTITYRRLHHRMKHITAFSKKCQETCQVWFKQSIVNAKIIKLAMLEAKLFNCL